MIRTSSLLRAGSLALLAVLAGCTFHSSATHWNGIVGRDGKPIFVKATTNVGLNLAILIPIFGSTSIDEMMDESTREIASKGSNFVRVIETSSENYWYGVPPITWFVTPVITTVNVEYHPCDAELEAAARANAGFEERMEERKREDHSHVIPDRRR